MSKWILILVILLIPIRSDAGQPAIYVENIYDAIALSETIKKDILIIFTADWCINCEKMKKDIHNNQSIIEDKIICYIDIDENKNNDLIKEYKVKSIPDYFILRNNIEISRKVGYHGKDKFIEWINNVK